MTRTAPRLAAALVLTALAVPALTTPAGAAVGTTNGTVNLVGGDLTMSVPATASASGSVAAGTSIDLVLGQTEVNDARGTLLGWTVTATATALTAPGGGPTRTIPLESMEWVTGSMTAVSGSLTGVSAGAGGRLDGGAVTVARALLQGGGGIYRYNPKIAVTVPAGVLPGAYTTSIVQTVS